MRGPARLCYREPDCGPAVSLPEPSGGPSPQNPLSLAGPPRVMTDAEILDELCELLCLLPGVSVAWKQTTRPGLRIGLRIEDARSLALMVHCNAHWNILFCVEKDWNCSEPHDDPDCLRYDVRIAHREQRYAIGQGLIDRLKARGLLTPADAERRKQMWLYPENP